MPTDNPVRVKVDVVELVKPIGIVRPCIASNAPVTEFPGRWRRCPQPCLPCWRRFFPASRIWREPRPGRTDRRVLVVPPPRRAIGLWPGLSADAAASSACNEIADMHAGRPSQSKADIGGHASPFRNSVHPNPPRSEQSQCRQPRSTTRSGGIPSGLGVDGMDRLDRRKTGTGAAPCRHGTAAQHRRKAKKSEENKRYRVLSSKTYAGLHGALTRMALLLKQ